MIRLAGLLLLSAAAAGALPALPAEEHPSLLCTGDRLPELRQRILREPYATWWRTVRARAQAVPASFSSERERIDYAKSLAFVYALTDTTRFADSAARLLAETLFPPRGGDLGEPHAEGEAVAHYAIACDLVHGYLSATDPATLAAVRQILAEEAERLYVGIVVQEINLGPVRLTIRLHETGHLDNWHLRAYAGLGLAAYALSDHPGVDGHTPQQWAERAHELVTDTFAYQIEEEDGGYAEGPFYLRYAADVYLPYLFALRSRQGIDLFADPLVRAVHRWSLNLRLPGGRRPNIDDGHLDDFYGHYLAGVDELGGVYRWDWETDENGLYVRQHAEMDAIAWFDDGVAAIPPDHGPTVFMPGAGDAVFRSDWSAAGRYLLLRGEHGPVREHGLAHEHPDETSLILCAWGEMLVVDAGYIEFASHDRVYNGSNHSLVLVDGAGPPLHEALGQFTGGGSDAYIERTYDLSFADYAEVRAAYAGVEMRRRVLFAGERYFLVADELRDDVQHQYEWRLHGNGGGSSGGAYERAGNLARWTRPGAELWAYLPEREGRTCGERDTIHSFDYRRELTHTVLRVEQQGDDVDFLALLYPEPAGAAGPQVSTLDAGDAQALSLVVGDTSAVSWLRGPADTVTVAVAAGDLVSDGAFGWVEWVAGEPRRLAVHGGTHLVLEGSELFRADQAVDVSLQVDTAGVLTGFVRGPGTGFSLVLAARTPVELLTFGGSLLDSSGAAGRLQLRLAGEGDLRVEPAGPVSDTKPADFDGSGSVDFADFFLFADAFGHPADATNRPFDLNQDGSIDLLDFFLFADAFGT